MRQNRIIISCFVLLMGLIIIAPQAYILHRFYLIKGDIVTAIYEKSEKATNAKDTVAMPFYRFSRNIGPIVQTCFQAFPSIAHSPDSAPQFKELQLKIIDKCDDYVILNNKPTSAFILVILGLLLSLIGANLLRIAVGSPK